MRRARLLSFLVLLIVPRAARPQGSPQGPEFRVNTKTAGAQREPSVAADASGDFVVVWTSALEDGSQDGVFGQRYSSAGPPADSEFRVNTYTTSIQQHPAVAAAAAGDFVVVWEDVAQDGSLAGIFGQRYDGAGAVLGAEFRVNSYTTSGQYDPSVAADASGNFIVVWTSYGQDGLDFGVFGQRYASTGAPLGPEFQVNTQTAGRQWRPVVAADASGSFVVVWQDDLDIPVVGDRRPGSNRGVVGVGVFGQRYASSGAALGPEFRVNTYTSGYEGFSSVAMGSAGNFVVVWRSAAPDGSNDGIFGQRYASSGAPLGPEFRVNSYTTGFQRRPAVAADSSGNFVVTWQSSTQDGSGYGVFGQRYDSTGAALGSEFLINTYTTGSQSVPAVAADLLGDFVVVWGSEGQDGSDYGVFGQRYSPIVPVELMHFRVE